MYLSASMIACKELVSEFALMWLVNLPRPFGDQWEDDCFMIPLLFSRPFHPKRPTLNFSHYWAGRGTGSKIPTGGNWQSNSVPFFFSFGLAVNPSEPLVLSCARVLLNICVCIECRDGGEPLKTQPERPERPLMSRQQTNNHTDTSCLSPLNTETDDTECSRLDRRPVPSGKTPVR